MVNSMGTGGIWSDLDKPIIHFGSEPEKPTPEEPKNHKDRYVNKGQVKDRKTGWWRR